MDVRTGQISNGGVQGKSPGLHLVAKLCLRIKKFLVDFSFENFLPGCL